MEGERAREGLAILEPLFTLRYSATHRDPRHLVYRLDPVRAAELGLVKQVEVLAVEQVGGAPLEVVEVRADARGPRARVRLERAGRDGPRPELRTLRPGADLRALTRREAYAGLVVSDIDVRRSAVCLTDGTERTLADGDRDRAGRLRAQIHAAVEEHLARELRHRERLGPGRLKVLTLFFVDRVAAYDAPDGRVRRWFLEAWRSLTGQPRFAALSPFPDEDRVHAGWFARRRGRAVDTRGRSRADEEAYDLILRDKERLLDPAEPLRFLFTHSALREGWDNPNVFVVCTLATTHSVMRKRQEIGRGLRLPVLADGTRCRDPELTRLTVVSNASYEAFCRALQREHAQDRGHGPAPPVRRHGDRHEVDEAARLRAIAPQLSWELSFGEAWLDDAIARLQRAPPVQAGLRRTRGTITPTGRGEVLEVTTEAGPRGHAPSVPALAARLADRTRLRRTDCTTVLEASGRAHEAALDVDALLERAEEAITGALRAALGAHVCVTGEDGDWIARPAAPPPDLAWASTRSLVVPSPVGPLAVRGVAQGTDHIWMQLRG
jgi:type III restriction enzyme